MIACEEYSAANGIIYTESGQYEILLQSVSSCDSIIMIDLEIVHLDSSVSLLDNVLTSNAINVNYQWVDCATNTAIEGETSSSFSPDENGSYAVIVSDSLCSISSSCFSITSLGISSPDPEILFYIYPNPSKEVVYIEHDLRKDAKLKLTDDLGRVLLAKTLTPEMEMLDLSDLAPGIYYLIIQQGSTLQRKKIIKI
jgi:hypothetical protein